MQFTTVKSKKIREVFNDLCHLNYFSLSFSFDGAQYDVSVQHNERKACNDLMKLQPFRREGSSFDRRF